MIKSSILLPSLLLASLCFTILGSCNKDSEKINLPMDYRGQWIGEYSGTKSNVSFDDDVFSQPIAFEVSIDSTTTDHIIVNGITLPIDEEGAFGPEFLENAPSTNMAVRFDDPEITIESFGSIPNGIVAPCFIKATKQ